MNKKQLIIDVREPFEYESDRIDSAINIPLDSLRSNPTELEGLEKDVEIILYCRSGNRAGMAMQLLKELGFTNLVNGINAEHVAKNYSPELTKPA